MSPRPAKFRQSDIARAMRAVRSAGSEIARVEIDADGKIVIVCGSPKSETVSEARAALSDYERWKQKREEKKQTARN